MHGTTKGRTRRGVLRPHPVTVSKPGAPKSARPLVPDHVVDQRANELQRRAADDLALRVGRVIVERLWGGDAPSECETGYEPELHRSTTPGRWTAARVKKIDRIACAVSAVQASLAASGGIESFDEMSAMRLRRVLLAAERHSFDNCRRDQSGRRAQHSRS